MAGSFSIPLSINIGSGYDDWMPLAHTVQTAISLDGSNSRNLVLHEKDYLQPFEHILARMELKGLGFNIVSFDGRTNTHLVEQSSENDFDERLGRLTFFDWISSTRFSPTVQACREGASPKSARGDRSFPKRRVLRFGPHGIHEYRGKFFPQLVRGLCNIPGLAKGSVVLDPMCGSGTTLVEGRSLDMETLGIDRNPLSVLVSKVKTSSIAWDKMTTTKARRLLCTQGEELLGQSEDRWSTKDSEYLLRWFSANALAEISGMLSMVDSIEDEEIRGFALVCLSGILREVSYQKEDDLRVRKQVRQYRQGYASKRFRETTLEKLDSIERLVNLDSGHTTRFAVKLGDARTPERHFRSYLGNVDLVITSPPYATALPYLDTDRLSLVVLGLLSREYHRAAELDMIGTREISTNQRDVIWHDFLRSKNRLPESVVNQIETVDEIYKNRAVGFRRKNLSALLSKYFIEMELVLRGIQRMLRLDCGAFVVVGNNSTRVDGTRIEIHTDELMADLARQVGFAVESKTNMDLLSSHDIFKLNRGSREQILHLVKT